MFFFFSFGSFQDFLFDFAFLLYEYNCRLSIVLLYCIIIIVLYYCCIIVILYFIIINCKCRFFYIYSPSFIWASWIYGLVYAVTFGKFINFKTCHIWGTSWCFLPSDSFSPLPFRIHGNYLLKAKHIILNNGTWDI